MKSPVVDASVLVKLFFDEQYSDAAAECLSTLDEAIAPDLIWVESANVVWKRNRRGELSDDDAAEIVEQMLLMPIRTFPVADLVEEALNLAVRTSGTVHDCLYLALAVRRDTLLLTADEKLFNALSAGPLARHIRFVAKRN